MNKKIFPVKLKNVKDFYRKNNNKNIYIENDINFALLLQP